MKWQSSLNNLCHKQESDWLHFKTDLYQMQQGEQILLKKWVQLKLNFWFKLHRVTPDNQDWHFQHLSITQTVHILLIIWYSKEFCWSDILLNIIWKVRRLKQDCINLEVLNEWKLCIWALHTYKVKEIILREELHSYHIWVF